MSDINEIDLRLIDTTVLLVFLKTMRHRKATSVAAEMGLTQPAVSHALRRLRHIYDDPLFLRRAHGLEPTALAHELEPKIRRIVRLLSESLEGAEEFNPRSAKMDLRIGAFDYELSSLIPDLVAELQKEAPTINIHSYPLDNQAALDALVQGQIDLSIGYFDFPDEGETSFIFEKLYEETYVLAARRGHPLFDAELTLEAISKGRHVLISPRGPSRNLVDHALSLQGLRRNVQIVVPSLYSALSIVENSDLVVALPRRVAERNMKRFQITHRILPIEGGTFELHTARHIRNAGSPFHKWLQDVVLRLI